MEERVKARSWGEGWPPQGKPLCHCLLGQRGGTVVTRAPTPPCRSYTVVRSSHPSSQPWRNLTTPSTLTLSSHPAHPRVRPLSGLSAWGWYRREAGNGAPWGTGVVRISGRPGHVGRQAMSVCLCGTVTLSLSHAACLSHSGALWASLCLGERASCVGGQGTIEKAGPLPQVPSRPLGGLNTSGLCTSEIRNLTQQSRGGDSLAEQR